MRQIGGGRCDTCGRLLGLRCDMCGRLGRLIALICVYMCEYVCVCVNVCVYVYMCVRVYIFVLCVGDERGGVTRAADWWVEA